MGSATYLLYKSLKIIFIINYKMKINAICDQEFRKNECNHIQEVLLQNRYSEKYISNVKPKHS